MRAAWERRDLDVRSRGGRAGVGGGNGCVGRWVRPARYHYAGQEPYFVAGVRGDRGTLCTLRCLGVVWGHQGLLRAAVEVGNHGAAKSEE